MKQFRQVLAVIGIALAGASSARAYDAEDAKAIIDKAIKAQGGREKLEKLQGHTVKFKGKFHGMGQAIDMAGEISTQGNDKIRMDIEVEAGGMKFRFVNVVNGDKGWIKMGDDTKEMSKDEHTEALQQAYSGWVGTLTPLAGKEFKLSTTGEMKINDKPALGVKVTSKGRRDVDLFFDKESGLLVKAETRVKMEGSDQEVTEESFASDYKDVQGTKQAMKFTVKRDGKLFVEGEATEILLAEKLDASLFTKP